MPELLNSELSQDSKSDHKSKYLTLFIPIDYSIHIDTMSMELSILYFKSDKILSQKILLVLQTVHIPMKCHL